MCSTYCQPSFPSHCFYVHTLSEILNQYIRGCFPFKNKQNTINKQQRQHSPFSFSSLFFSKPFQPGWICEIKGSLHTCGSELWWQAKIGREVISQQNRREAGEARSDQGKFSQQQRTGAAKEKAASASTLELKRTSLSNYCYVWTKTIT